MIPGFDDTLKNARPPVAPAIGGGSAPELGFPGIGKPTSDLQAVRDGRRSTLLAYLVDLSIARSFAAGTQLLLPIAGNVFMSDPLFDLAGNAQAGVARVHFQDENFNPVGTYVTVLPSSIYKVPFTQVAIENYAQAGKFLYIVYGVDVDLVPGASQQVQATVLNTVVVAGNQGVNNPLTQYRLDGTITPLSAAHAMLAAREMGFAYGASFKSVALLVSGGTEQVFSAAGNPNGALLWGGQIVSIAAAGQQTVISLHAHTAAPAVFTDGDVQLEHLNWNATLAGVVSHTPSILTRSVFIPAGKGLWFLNTGNNEVTAKRNLLYTLL